MKIAILTQPLGHNYGGIMQAWALQTVLREKGHIVETIDRRAARRGALMSLLRLGLRLGRKFLRGSKQPVFLEKHIEIVSTNTREFIDTKLNISPAIYDDKSLMSYFFAGGFEAVVVGSDQVWRPAYSPNIYNFFLDFLEKSDAKTTKRIAYAASFGVDKWEFTPEQTKRCQGLAKRIDAISVREASGIELCSEHLDVAASKVLDPTLLLTREYYEDLCAKTESLQSSEYIYAYLLNKNSHKLGMVQQVADYFQLKAINFRGKAESTASQTGGSESDPLPPVEQWLNGFRQARFVVTDSYHGAIFATIFQKPFLVLDNPGRGSSRFESLLAELNMSERFVKVSDANFDIEGLDRRPISAADLEELRSKSLAFLNENL